MSNKQKQEIMTTVTLNKIATVITESNGFNTVKSMNKQQFFATCSTLSNIEIKCSVAIKQTVKKLESLGFNVLVDNSFGFEWECKLICSK